MVDHYSLGLCRQDPSLFIYALSHLEESGAKSSSRVPDSSWWFISSESILGKCGRLSDNSVSHVEPNGQQHWNGSLTPPIPWLLADLKMPALIFLKGAYSSSWDQASIIFTSGTDRSSELNKTIEIFCWVLSLGQTMSSYKCITSQESCELNIIYLCYKHIK